MIKSIIICKKKLLGEKKGENGRRQTGNHNIYIMHNIYKGVQK